MITTAVDASTMDPIVQLRRDAYTREELITSLTKLITKATLDEGQLTSFLAALQHPVHCTQGPPGTGKSYVGKC